MKFICGIIVLFAVILSSPLFSQKLEIDPDDLRFEDIFSRLENTLFINKGTLELRIDSVVYKSNLYYLRFDSQYSMPFYIDPGDTVKMDCILAGYYFVPSADTSDTMYVYSNSINGVEDVKIEIKYWDDDFHPGTINGYLTDSLSLPLSNADIYFFYEGNYLINTAVSDQYGFYSSELPPGSYTVAAVKDSYYVTFFGQKYDPFNAEFILLEEDSVKRADIILPKEIITPYSVSGFIYDSLSGTPLQKGIVVVRNGTHTPTKSAAGSRSVTDGIYTTFINEQGFYRINNITQPDYYYIQSFSDYFIPSYYSLKATSQLFWQDADSVFIDSGLSNLNISMPRDSSLGGGIASGFVNINAKFGGNISDVIIYAQPTGNDSLSFNYAFTSQNGNFQVPFLPYGDYRLVAQKIGYYDGYSSVFTIDSINTSIGNIEIDLASTSVENPSLPEDHVLLYNYPNPFNPSTIIGFVIPFSSEVELNVYNILGEKVKNILTDHLIAGSYEFNFTADNLSSGTYFVILKTKENITAKKILFIK